MHERKMEGLLSQNHVVFVVFEEGNSHEEHAVPDQEGHGSQGEHTDQNSDDDCEHGGGDGGTWGHRLTRNQGRKSPS